MSYLATLPVWLLALVIFALRIVDVSLGTVRTIAVVQGWIKLSVALGFFELLIWITAVSQVFTRIAESPLLAVAFAAGFAAGNAAGILLEQHLALGACAVRLITAGPTADAMAAEIRAIGQRVTIFPGQGRDGPRAMVYVTCNRRDLPQIIDLARRIDDQLYFAVDRVMRTSSPYPLPHPTGWRAVFKKK